MMEDPLAKTINPRLFWVPGSASALHHVYLAYGPNFVANACVMYIMYTIILDGVKFLGIYLVLRWDKYYLTLAKHLC